MTSCLMAGKRLLFFDSSNQEEEVEEVKTILSLLIFKQIKNTLEFQVFTSKKLVCINLVLNFFPHIFSVERPAHGLKIEPTLYRIPVLS